MSLRLLWKLSLASCLLACGSSDVELTDRNGNGDGGMIVDGSTPGADANPNAADAMPATCFADGAACNNCIDDDEDGYTDGADPECTSYDDDDESSFATGIPGDNQDAIIQDCFFDGDSGGGNDGCAQHVCCLLEPFVDCCESGQTAEADGCLQLTGPAYNPNNCAVSETCTQKCGALTPPGCDCFGCCTVCNGADCVDILTNPGVYQEENCTNFDNPSQGQCCESEKLSGCYTCTKADDCSGGDCEVSPTDCILCPGQTDADLPEECGDMQTCPDGEQACELTENCGENQYCSGGCCVDAIIVN